MRKAFKVTAGNWRGIGPLDDSAYALKDNLSDYDATQKIQPQTHHRQRHPPRLPMPQRHRRQNQTSTMPPFPKNLHTLQTRWSLHGQQRRHLSRLGQKRSRKRHLSLLKFHYNQV